MSAATELLPCSDCRRKLEAQALKATKDGKLLCGLCAARRAVGPR